MILIREPLQKEYERWLGLIGDDPYCEDCVIGIHDVLRAHFLLLDYFATDGEGIGGIGPKSLDLLHSAISRQLVGYGGKRKWTDDFDICATLFFGLIKNHPWVGGNKRTATHLTDHFLRINGYEIVATTAETIWMVTGIEADTLDLAGLTKWMRDHIEVIK